MLSDDIEEANGLLIPKNNKNIKNISEKKIAKIHSSKPYLYSCICCIFFIIIVFC